MIEAWLLIVQIYGPSGLSFAVPGLPSLTACEQLMNAINDRTPMSYTEMKYGSTLRCIRYDARM